MESKKDPRLDLEHRRGMFLNVGLIISISLAIMAFEWRSVYTGPMVQLVESGDVMEVMEIPPTVHSPPPPPPKPVPVVIVESKEEVEKEIVEIDNEYVEDYDIPEVVIVEDIPEEPVDVVFTIVEQKPLPVGGVSAFFKFFSKNMKYPNQARRMGIEGKVFVQFIVDKDGSLTEIEVIKGIGAGCDEEAVRVLLLSPKWNPGKQRGKPVKVRMVLPIDFRLG